MKHLAGATLLLLAACGAPEPEAEAWHRIDLWAEEASVERTPAASIDVPAEVLPAGLRRLGVVGRMPGGSKAPRRVAGEQRILALPGGLRLLWHLELGPGAYLSFVPAGGEDESRCRPRYRVLAAAEGAAGPSLLLDHDHEAAGALAPPPLLVDLAAFEGPTRIALEGAAGSCPPGSATLWASPAVYHRRPVPEPPGSAERPNLLLVSFDALRADALGAYGKSPSPSPAFDRLAEESELWERAFATSNATNPSFASILTGLYARDHGVYSLGERLGPGPPTLAERLATVGYETGAIVSARHLGAGSGLGRGFSDFLVPEGQLAAELAVELAMDWIAERERPFFLWLHVFDPHTPHTPPRPFALGYRPAAPFGLGPSGAWPGGRWIPFREPGPLRFEQARLGGHRELYAGEVAYLDRQLDRLLAFLESRGLLERSLLTIASDHGENLGEHGVRFRHAGLWDTTLHVPLLLRRPGRQTPGSQTPGRRHGGLAQTLDLFPTLLHAAGLEPPPQAGLDLGRWAEPGFPGRRLVFAEHVDRRGAMVRGRRYLYATLEGHPTLPDGPYLYDLEADPEQTENLAGRGLAAERALAGRLAAWLAEGTEGDPTPAPNLDAEDRERLRALGYLDS